MKEDELMTALDSLNECLGQAEETIALLLLKVSVLDARVMALEPCKAKDNASMDHAWASVCVGAPCRYCPAVRA